MEDKIKALETAVAGLQEQNKTVQDASKSNLDALYAKFDTLHAAQGYLAEQIKTLEAQNAALSEQVASLTEQVENFKAPVPGVSGTVGEEKRATLPEAKIFKIGSKEVRFKFAAFFLHGQKVFAHEVALDKDLREKVAKEYPGLIEPAE